jgi:hypothetical protein
MLPESSQIKIYAEKLRSSFENISIFHLLMNREFFQKLRVDSFSKIRFFVQENIKSLKKPRSKIAALMPLNRIEKKTPKLREEIFKWILEVYLEVPVFASVA